MASRKNTPAGAKAQLKGIAAVGTVAEVPIAMETVFGITNRIAAALEAVERRLGDAPGAVQPVRDAEQSRLAKKLSNAFARGTDQNPGPGAPSASMEVPSVEVLARELDQRSANLRQRVEDMKVTLYQGASSPVIAVEGDARSVSYGPSKDALLGAHANMAAIEDSLDSIASYLR